MEPIYPFTRFTLFRTTDITGISGTGEIALGVQYPDGQCSLWWGKHHTTGIYPSMEKLQEIHCYHNNASIEWCEELYEQPGLDEGGPTPGSD